MPDLIALTEALAWPVVALLALFYVWRSDAISKLINISKSVDDLKDQLAHLVVAEERLSRSSASFAEITATIETFRSDLISMKSDVESIRDQVANQPADRALPNQVDAGGHKESSQLLFDRMDDIWRELVSAMIDKFGYIDGRMVGAAAWGLAHGNRKGPKLDYDQAEEIGRLHSDIKSFRRRRASVDEWLSTEIAEEFCTDVAEMIEVVETI